MYVATRDKGEARGRAGDEEALQGSVITKRDKVGYL
jgi:hypothetical protein